jgi:hypothetical protein
MGRTVICIITLLGIAVTMSWPWLCCYVSSSTYLIHVRWSMAIRMPDLTLGIDESNGRG